MLTGLYSAATSMDAAEFNQRVVAKNLANVDMPGYRRQVASFETILSDVPGDRAGRLGTQVRQIHRDFTPGGLNTTGSPLDLAIDGDGFFTLQSPDGPVYTRNGVFHLDGANQLVASSGYPVLSGGNPITVPADVSPSQIHIAQDGTLFASGAQVGKLDVVQFPDNNRLEIRGQALFVANGMDSTPAEARVVQGSRELSNVSATDEMIQMIIGLRQHEAAQRAIRSISETLEQHTRGQ